MLSCEGNMNSIAPNDKIQWLERRHTELIDELDALNSRLESALISFAKSSEPESSPELFHGAAGH
jgi:hypothetical protein